MCVAVVVLFRWFFVRRDVFPGQQDGARDEDGLVQQEARSLDRSRGDGVERLKAGHDPGETRFALLLQHVMALSTGTVIGHVVHLVDVKTGSRGSTGHAQRVLLMRIGRVILLKRERGELLVFESFEPSGIDLQHVRSVDVELPPRPQPMGDLL